MHCRGVSDRMSKTQTDTAEKRSDVHGLTRDELLRAYRTMLLSRAMDDKQMKLLKQGKAFFHIGGSGHEAAQIAAATALRPGFDWACPYYRDQAFSLHFGMTPEEIFLAAL